ncbi:MAG: DNA-3-methyladenine glycosylase 2 family protein [Rhodococcus sp.]|nr:DNA-3-methyladenine glycosylase 2 family protein [Rhodococcus sp. (in: high G+C Gram-positive bacteria)]
MIVRLPYEPPLAHRPLWNALAAHAVSGLERRDPHTGSHSRVIECSSGLAQVTLTVRPESCHVEADVESAEADADEVIEIVRSWLDLDAVPTVIDSALRRDPVLAPLVGSRPGMRRLGSVDGFETAVLTVLGQQVSVAAARTFGSRLVSAYGRDHGSFRLFPTPERLAAEPTETLRVSVGLTRSRARTVTALATAACDGLSLRSGTDPARFRRELLALPGIGPWTADYLAVRVLGDPDAFTPGDLVLRRALGVDSGIEAARLAENWRPWRAYALFHLWADAVYG